MPILLNADPVRVTQMMGNLLNNALKFTNENGVVWVTLRTEEDNAVISIKDNGIGMSPEILPYLFSPFTQADKTLDRNGGGLGLGLYIVEGIVKLHGGSVKAKSDGLGKGSTFTIRLPFTEVKNITSFKQELNNSDDKNLKILIIEDNRDFADLLNTMLSTIGHTVNIAYDGEDGLKLAKQLKPDIIICDIGLPGMDGYEVAKSIRDDLELSDLNLIALTGYANDADSELAREARFDKHLAKPIDFGILKSTLDKVANK